MRNGNRQTFALYLSDICYNTTSVYHLLGERWTIINGGLHKNFCLNAMIDHSHSGILVQDDVITQKQTEQDLLVIHKLLTGVAEATNRLLVTADYDQAINEALSILGSAAQVDRVCIFQNRYDQSTDQFVTGQAHEWCTAAVQPQITNAVLQNISYASLGINLYEILSTGKVWTGMVRDLLLPLRKKLDTQSIVSLMIVPIMIETDFWGFITFHDCRRERRWTKNEQTILTTLAAGIGGAIKHQQIKHQAYHDALTGLPNRTLFSDRLAIALAQAERSKSLVALMFIDLDYFKEINDTLGHDTGDFLLQKLAMRLLACVRQGDTVARMGGDEFTIILPDLKGTAAAKIVAQRVIDSLQQPLSVNDTSLTITTSVGISIYPIDGNDIQLLTKNADRAMYRAKSKGRNNYQLYNEQT